VKRALTRTHRTHQRGFSLLEAVVAMVLISGAGYALFGWINSSIMALSRIQESNARSAATQNILEYIDSINPMLKPEGDALLGSYKIRWKAEPISLVQDGSAYPRGSSLYQLALYDTLIKVETDDQKLWFDFRLRQVGYKKVRVLSLEP
jgi:general secretion pathway protein I